jgi:hypothetical protein
MLTLNNPPLTQHISIPKDLSQLSCEAFSAGVVEGVLEGLDMVSLDLSASASSSPYGQSDFRNTGLYRYSLAVLGSLQE